MTLLIWGKLKGCCDTSCCWGQYLSHVWKRAYRVSHWAIDKARVPLREASQQCLLPYGPQRKPISPLMDRVIKSKKGMVHRQRTMSPLIVFTHLGICKDLCNVHSKCQVHKRVPQASLMEFPVLGRQACLSVGCGRNQTDQQSCFWQVDWRDSHSSSAFGWVSWH